MNIKTVDESNIMVNPLYQRQREGVSKMRTSLLSCNDDGVISTSQVLRSVTAMRVYHQLTRIIRYLEIMDKLENKLYESIDYTIDNSDITDIKTLNDLMVIQERLQKSMIESHKLLQPYLDLDEFLVVDLVPSESTTEQSSEIMNPEDRDRLRTNAQAVLQQLQELGGT